LNLLLDTNIFLEILLDQHNKEHSIRILKNEAKHNLFITSFAYFSIGIVLFRENKPFTLPLFINDITDRCNVTLVYASREVGYKIAKLKFDYHLDFVDAYHYGIAELHQYKIVSFDTDFDHTPLGRLQPQNL